MRNTSAQKNLMELRIFGPQGSSVLAGVDGRRRADMGMSGDGLIPQMALAFRSPEIMDQVLPHNLSPPDQKSSGQNPAGHSCV